MLHRSPNSRMKALERIRTAAEARAQCKSRSCPSPIPISPPVMSPNSEHYHVPEIQAPAFNTVQSRGYPEGESKGIMASTRRSNIKPSAFFKIQRPPRGIIGADAWLDFNPWRVKIVIDPRTIGLAWQRFGQARKLGVQMCVS